MIPPELEAEILRLHHAEKWPVGTIASQLHVHHDAVRRALLREGKPKAAITRASMLDPYLPFVIETWKRYPTLTARRIYDMVCERGYPGGPDHFRHRVAGLRPRPKAEAYLRLRTLPGEQAQVDWGHFGHVTIGKAKRALMGFVMVLAYSRAVFLRFFLGAHMENFLRGHVEAFSHFGGVVRVALYDNLRSAVLERRGDAIRFHPTVLQLGAHYRFEVRPVAVGRGNEKGRVERQIRFVRDSFFAARPWTDLDDLNAQARGWALGRARDRPWPEDTTRTVREAFEEERPRLLGLPGDVFPTEERVEARVGKTPYVRFDGNDYSVPHTLTRRTLVVLASERGVRILAGTDVVAEHARVFGRGEQIEDPRHVAELVDAKRKARLHRGTDRLAHLAPPTKELLARVAERGLPLGPAVKALLALLDAYGAEALSAAVHEVLEKGAPHPGAVRHVLERRREAEGKPPALALHLPDDPRVREICVKPHDLASYDTWPEGDDDAQASAKEDRGDGLGPEPS